MAIGRQGGAIVIDKESPLTQLLGGIGSGIGAGVEFGMKKKKEEDQLEQEILVGTASGKYDPRIWHSQAGRDFLKAAKIDKRPGIMNLLSAGEALMPQPSGTGGEERVMPGGGVVNIPKPDETYLKTGKPELGYPSAKEVTDLIEQEKVSKALVAEQKQQDLMLARQISAYAAQDQIRRMRQIDPVMLTKDIEQGMVDQGLNLDDFNITVNERGGVSITKRGESAAERTTKVDKHVNRINSYNTHVGDVRTKKSAHQYRLRSILERDVAFEEMAVEEGVSAPVAKALNDAISALSKSASKDKILDRAQSVVGLLKTVNEELDSYNKRNMREGLAIGIPRKQLEDEQVKPLQFEDVTGGSTLQEWLSRQKPKSGKELISSLREETKGFVPGRPAASGATGDADKIKKVYDGIKEIVAQARGSNPSLASSDIHDSIMEMKGQLMAEYGLNERLFAYVMAMADKAFA